MSYRKSKSDLLARVRFSNPLPSPPCPPKLLDIPTHPSRYTKPEFLNSLASSIPLPMIVDADLGMPLDLSQWECLWEEEPDDSALNPDINNLPQLDPKDDFLAYEPASGSTSAAYTNGVNGHAAPLSSTPSSSVAPVSWLRKTEYISRGDGSRRNADSESKSFMPETIDVSRAAQIRDIEASFAACNDDFSLSGLRHPNKPHVTAVESFEVLPDVDIWANQYDLFKFSERPGERTLDVDDPRLDCAILRPMRSDYDSFLAYYLTPDDETSEKLKSVRASVKPYEVPPDEEPTTFQFVRDYETVKVEQEVPNEFLLLLDDGRAPKMGDGNGTRRGKGAYYKNIERKMILKKKRANASEQYADKWDVIRMTHAHMRQEEEDERQEALAEVMDPMFMMRDAEGEMEADIETETRPVNGGEATPEIDPLEAL